MSWEMVAGCERFASGTASERGALNLLELAEWQSLGGVSLAYYEKEGHFQALGSSTAQDWQWALLLLIFWPRSSKIT